MYTKAMDAFNQEIPGRYKTISEVPLNNLKKSTLNINNNQKKPSSKNNSDNIRDISCCSKIHQHFHSFADSASIDGIKFVTEKGRSIPERICWIIILLVALYFCVVLVIQTFQKWINSPVIVTFATSETPIFDVPFPAITICPEIKSEKELFNYTDIYLKKENNQNVTDFEETSFNYMSLICDTPSELLTNNSTIINDSVPILYFMLISPNFSEYIFELEWRGEKFENASDFFSPILTSEGVCYSFNIMDRSEIFTDIVSYPSTFFSTDGKYSKWSPETGYSEDSDLDSYPRRTLVAGAKGGLTLLLFVMTQNLDYACGDSLQGFKISVHQPGEIPRVKQDYFRLPLDQTVTASIKPNMMHTSENLRNYSPEDRKCYFEKEKKLQFFKIYNQQNCIIECLTNFTLRTCGCVNFNLPREESTPICSAIRKECMENAKVLFLASEVKYKIKQSKYKSSRDNLNMEDSNYTGTCDCLPSCVSLSYDVAISQSDWKWVELFNILKQTSEWDKDFEEVVTENQMHFSRMTIFFKEMQFITSERNEWQGYTDFWANIGGIIGLFTGFSFITMFEIIYYLSLRICCNVRMYGRRYWSGLPDVEN